MEPTASQNDGASKDRGQSAPNAPQDSRATSASAPPSEMSSGAAPQSASSRPRLYEPSPEDIENTLLLAGLLGSEPPQPVISVLEQTKTAFAEATRTALTAEAEALSASISELEEERLNDQREIGTLVERSAALDAEIRRTTVEAEGAALEFDHLTRRLRVSRATYPLKLFEQTLDRHAAAGRAINERIIQVETARFAVERQLYEIASQRRSLNEAEYNRRVAFLQERLDRATQRFLEHSQYLDALRRLGITRTSVGFLMWAGYLALTAVGWFFGDALNNLYNAQPGVLYAVLAVLLALVRPVFAHLGSPLGTVVITLLPLVYVAFLCAVLWVSDRLLKKIDPAWLTRQRRQRRRGEHDARGFWTWLANPTMRVLRTDYLQLLARLPIFYVWLAVPIALAVVIGIAEEAALPAAAAKLLRDPWQSLLFTYLGFVACILSTGFAVLYTAQIIEPRRKNLASGSTLTVSSTVKANIELLALVVITFATLATIISIDLVGIAQGPTRVYLGLVVATDLVLITSLTLAHAVIYRGAFRDFAALRFEVAEYEDEMQRYSALPALSEDDDERDRYREQLRQLQDRVDSAWNTADFWQRGSVAYPSLTIGAGDVDTSTDTAEAKFIGVRDFTVTAADEYIERDLVGQLDTAYSRLLEARARVESCRSQKQHLSATLAELKARDRESSLRSLRERLILCKQRQQLELARIEGAYRTQLSNAMTAHKLGVFLRSLITVPH